MTAAQKAVAWAVSMKGQRNKIVDIYNGAFKTASQRPRGYKVKYEDMLCATFVSSIFIALDWQDIVPPECGAKQLFQNMFALGRGVLNKKRTPDIGDLIFFGNGTTSASINHVGIVTEVKGTQIYYYDIQSVVARHTCPVGYSWIMGYGMPDYASKDGGETEPETPAVSGKIEAGDLVSIKAGAKWYSGGSIKASVLPQNWYVIQNKNGRVVLGMNEAETSNIQSPIREEDVVLVRKAGGESTAPVSGEPEPVIIERESFTASVKRETLVKLEALAKEKGVSVGEILDGMVAQNA